MAIFRGSASSAPDIQDLAGGNLQNELLSHGTKALELSPKEDPSILSCGYLPPVGEDFLFNLFFIH